MISLEDVRERANRFCAERAWAEYHTPNNLFLALLGEGGEVCEIFQWKSALASKQATVQPANLLTTREIEHVGEEIADVLVRYPIFCCF